MLTVRFFLRKKPLSRRLNPRDSILGIDPVLATQAIGGVGFLLLIAATFARSRRGFFVVDLLGLAPVAIHYALLNAMAGLVFSAFYMGVDVVTWWLGERYRRLTAWALYPLVLLLTWAFWEGPGDIVATAGTVLAIAARQQREVWRIQAIIAASTCCWHLRLPRGVMAAGRVLCSLWRLRGLQRHPLSPTPMTWPPL